MEAMGLGDGSSSREEERMKVDEEPAPAIIMSKEKILKEVKAKAATEKPVLSLVVIGHVDAGKSTLMGRVLHELGETTDREVASNQRQSEKIGKGSFAYAWTFDAMDEERERGVTIDVAIDTFSTQRKRFTLIDAPGHRDFVPNMISGAAQADVAILVVDGASGAFEKGFEGGGQTREHALLVRSLGVQQIIVAVNKLDAVRWSEVRYKNIFDQLFPFLTDIGFMPHKITFVPVSASTGENLTKQTNELLRAWYDGPTLVEELDSLPVPTRALDVALRIPVSNVFKGQSATASGLAVTGRVESGIVQVGEKLAALPGDESGIVRALEVNGELVPYATAGANATIFLSGIEANQLSVGSVLCPRSQPVPVVSTFTAQVLVFEPKHPITAGYAVELFHHSRDIPASIVALEAMLDKTTGKVTKTSPRCVRFP
ncbi:P-loop containing nucleoside triphosphate hydrolase protein [Rhodotorula toruloides]|uniref:Elongation factor 1 alpha-like protein n=1 Tax=Rhodotorula toruloides TaxID=5286 RepID=A0A2T0A914_RHOTO|nr:P-loop containing nucleoside triphosphate hydrolase protein [Rhodotorula toruloides]